MVVLIIISFLALTTALAAARLVYEIITHRGRPDYWPSVRTLSISIMLCGGVLLLFLGRPWVWAGAAILLVAILMMIRYGGSDRELLR
jgi:hypothetical protein